ncbi:MAG: 30S ribosomal protein S12 methylthiotransferase RimO, partial [Clostridia bacterium]|nr:30S ribosomal protein S12 methylthiotransferase RimO [Clostridia bacterium]
MLKNKKFGVISLGCDKNRVDAEKLIAVIKQNGCELTDDIKKAQVLIVNTCAFLESARTESIETVLECAAYKTGNLEKIVVTGCLPQKFISELFEPLVEADVFLGVRDYEEIFPALEKAYQTGERQNFVGAGREVFRKDRVLTT